MGSKTLILPEFYLRRDGLAVLDRYRQERQACVDFVTRTLDQAEADKRDLSDTEQETLKNQQARIAQLDAQIKPLAEFDQVRAASEQAVRGYSAARPTGPAGDDDQGDEPGEHRSLGFKAEQREHKYDTRGQVIVDMIMQDPGQYRSLSGTTTVTEQMKRAARDRLMGAHVRFPGAPQDYLQRISNETTSNLSGVLPKPIVGNVNSAIDAARPFVESIGAKDLGGIPGKSFSRPVVTQHTTSGKQTTEKTELSSQQLVIGGVDFTKETRGGTLDVSRQSIDWTSPAAWDAILEDLQYAYQIDTEETAANAFAGAVVQSLALPTSNDLAGWATWVYSAAALSYGGGKRMPTKMWVSLDMWAKLGAVVDTARRVNRRGTGADGSASPTTFAGEAIDLPRVVVPSLPAGTVILGVDTLTEFYEERIGLLSAVEPKLLGVEIAYGGYIAYGTLIPGAFVRSAGVWAASTDYELGQRILLDGDVLEVTTAGASGSTAPTAPGSVGGTVTDGTVVWTRKV